MITEEMLKAAAVEADQVILDSLPAPEECEREFSNSFRKKIRRISRRANHPVLYKFAKSVACFVLAVILTGGAWLTVDAEAREAFIRWIKETYSTYSVYHFEGTDSGTQTSEGQSSEEEISPKYSLAWIPDGYTEWATDTIGNCICETYVNESGELLNFNYEPSVDSPYWFIETSTSTQQRVYVGDVPADFYLSNSPDVSNTIVWTSPDGQMAFCLDGFFSKEELIDMAEHVRPCDPESVEK